MEDGVGTATAPSALPPPAGRCAHMLQRDTREGQSRCYRLMFPHPHRFNKIVRRSLVFQPKCPQCLYFEPVSPTAPPCRADSQPNVTVGQQHSADCSCYQVTLG